MSSGFVKTGDGTEIFYKDWGPRDAQPIMFHHGWPLSSDDWDAQMAFFVNKRDGRESLQKQPLGA